MERQILEEGTGVIYGSVFPQRGPDGCITYADVREAIHEDELLDFPFQFITPLGSVVKSVQEHKGRVMDSKVTIRRIEGQDSMRRYSPGHAGDGWNGLPTSQYEQGPDPVTQTFQGILHNLSRSTNPPRGRTPSSYGTPLSIPTTSSPPPALEYAAMRAYAADNNNTSNAIIVAASAVPSEHRLATPDRRATAGSGSPQPKQKPKRVRKPSAKMQDVAAEAMNHTQSPGNINATPPPSQPPHPHHEQQQQQQQPRESPGSASKKARRSDFMAWEEARGLVRALQLRGYNDWRNWCQSGGRPPTIPASPHVVYKDYWISWPDFLGTSARLRPAGALVESTPPPRPPSHSAAEVAAAALAEPPAGGVEPHAASSQQQQPRAVTTTATVVSFGDPRSAPESGVVPRHKAEAVREPQSVSQQQQQQQQHQQQRQSVSQQ